RAQDRPGRLVRGRARVLRLELVNRDPGAVETVRLEVAQGPLALQRLVEGGLFGVVLPGGQNAVGDRAADDRVLDSLPSQAAQVPVRVGMYLFREGQLQLEQAEAAKRGQRRVDGDARSARQVVLDPAVGHHARVR